MTHAPETGAIDRLRFFPAPGFRYVCHANLAPDQSINQNVHLYSAS